MMDKIETQVREGKRAQVLLNDPLLKQAFEDLLETYKQEIFYTNFADDDKRIWATANRTLASFINNDAITTNSDGEQVPEKTNLSQVVTPRTDT